MSEHISKQRTLAQNNSIHLFCKILADTLNESGLDMKTVLKPTVNIPWTTTSVKKFIWSPIQKAMYDTESTTMLHKIEQIDKIHKVIMRELGEKFEIEYIPFPSNEEYQLLKLRYKK